MNDLYPMIIDGIVYEPSSESLFQIINDNTLLVKNPQYVIVYGMFNTEFPQTKDLKVLDNRFIDNNYLYWRAVPLESEKSGYFEGSIYKKDCFIEFPKGNVYYVVSRGLGWEQKSYILDTRFEKPQPPTKVLATDSGNNRIKISWQDSSPNKTAFHIFAEELVGDAWVRVGSGFIRVDASQMLEQSITWQAPKPGYYRFAVRTAFSSAEKQFSFITKSILREDASNTFTVPQVLYFSKTSNSVEVLVNGTFPNPLAPTNFGGTIQNDKSLFFVWTVNSTNESVFHILEETLINNVWVRTNQFRVPARRRSWTISTKAKGTYRYALRSAYSYPNTSIVRTSSLSSWLQFVIT